jgi:hypothetical protein
MPQNYWWYYVISCGKGNVQYICPHQSTFCAVLETVYCGMTLYPCGQMYTISSITTVENNRHLQQRLLELSEISHVDCALLMVGLVEVYRWHYVLAGTLASCQCCVSKLYCCICRDQDLLVNWPTGRRQVVNAVLTNASKLYCCICRDLIASTEQW